MAPAVPSTTRQAARLRNSSVGSKHSLSAAAGLVVKPSTPPRMATMGVQGHAIDVANPAAKAPTMNSTVSEGSKAAALRLPMNSTEGAAAKTEELLVAEIPVQTVVEEIPSQVSIEVRSLSGETVLCTEFALADQALSVKQRLQRVRKIPLWQQMLTFQGEMVQDSTKLQDLQLPSSGTVFELMVRAGPSDQDVETMCEAKELLKQGADALNSIRKGDVKEVRCFAKPPPAAEKACLAALHLLAGSLDSIPVKRNGKPKDANWAGCQKMLDDSQFIEQLRSLSSHIDNGKLSKERMEACHQLIQDMYPEAESDSEKIREMGRSSLMCQRLLQHLICIRNYYDSMAELSERYGGATITALMAKC